MRVAHNDEDDSAGLRVYVQFNKYIYTHTHTKSCTSNRESVSPLSRLIRGFRKTYH